LRQHPSFGHVPADWFERLAELRFTGEVWAIPEGTVVFAGEPLLRVTAPLAQAQLVETYLVTTMAFQTLVASKAARVATAAKGRPVFDFGSRRAHGPQAGLLAARAAYMGGCVGTSNAEAARLLDIPSMGTQAHSWVMAFGDEIAAFRAFGQVFPQSATMLVDTYDTVQGVRNALASGAPMQAVRLDSGDLGLLSKEVRQILDEAGRHDVRVVASGDLNEYRIRDLLAGVAPIDVFGVGTELVTRGTELVTSRDDPTLNVVYKLVEQETATGRVGRLKRSAGKKTYPYAKQVYRQSDSDGGFVGDRVVDVAEQEDGLPLVEPVLCNGQLVKPLPSLEQARARFVEQRGHLPQRLLDLEPCELYPVLVSPWLQAEAARLAPGPIEHTGEGKRSER
jgi:nicotinate phosphoribosyltransferase